MTYLRRFFAWPISSQGFDLNLVRMMCYLAAPVVLLLGLQRLETLTLTPGEIFLGLLGVLNLALLLVILGVVIPLAGSKQKVE